MTSICSCGTECDCKCGCNRLSACLCSPECKCDCACTKIVTLKSVAARVALRYGSELTSNNPNIIVGSLNELADYIDMHHSPRISAVKQALFRILLATDRTLSVSIRDALVTEIARIVPGEFGGEIYDTNPAGKGFRPGYISFGLKPQTWEAADIIGGILFMCEYDPSLFRSESPDPQSPNHAKWQGRSQNEDIIELENIEIGYYNKKIGGKVSDKISLGKVGVLIDAKEQVISIIIEHEAGFAEGVKNLIQEIKNDPPAVAQSEAFKKRNRSPTESPKALLTWLNRTNRQDVGKSEIEALANAMAARSERPLGTVLEEIKQFFTKRHWPINPNI